MTINSLPFLPAETPPPREAQAQPSSPKQRDDFTRTYEQSERRDESLRSEPASAQHDSRTETGRGASNNIVQDDTAEHQRTADNLVVKKPQNNNQLSFIAAPATPDGGGDALLVAVPAEVGDPTGVRQSPMTYLSDENVPLATISIQNMSEKAAVQLPTTSGTNVSVLPSPATARSGIAVLKQGAAGISNLNLQGSDELTLVANEGKGLGKIIIGESATSVTGAAPPQGKLHTPLSSVEDVIQERSSPKGQDFKSHDFRALDLPQPSLDKPNQTKTTLSQLTSSAPSSTVAPELNTTQQVILSNPSGEARPAGGVSLSPIITANAGGFSEPVRQIADAIRIHRSDQSITVRLDPPELGNVSIDLSFDKSAKLVTAVVAAEQTDTTSLLRRQLDSLQKELSLAGFEGVSVELSNNHQEDNSPAAYWEDGGPVNDVTSRELMAALDRPSQNIISTTRIDARF